MNIYRWMGRAWFVGVAALYGCDVQPECDRLEAEAIDHVVQVVQANGSCEFDTDCIVVGVSGSCFDICTRAVHVDGVQAVDAALAEAESFCAAQPLSCEFFVPPCAPPDVPLCIEGVCL